MRLSSPRSGDLVLAAQVAKFCHLVVVYKYFYIRYMYIYIYVL